MADLFALRGSVHNLCDTFIKKVLSLLGPGAQDSKIYTHSSFFSFRFETKRTKFHIEKNI